MNTYYLHNGIESSGPYTLDELVQKNICTTTPVWCPGMEDWKTAAEINTLKHLLPPTPPPLSKTVHNFRTGVKSKPQKNYYLGLSRKMFYFLIFLFLLVIITIGLNSYHENRLKEIELVNYETEKQNVIFKQKQIAIEEKKIQMAILKQINEDRAAKQRKIEIIEKLNANKELRATAKTYLNNAIDKLQKAENFHIFRTTEEREKEIFEAEMDYENWKNEIRKIESENDQLKLEYEKLPR